MPGDMKCPFNDVTIYGIDPNTDSKERLFIMTQTHNLQILKFKCRFVT